MMGEYVFKERDSVSHLYSIDPVALLNGILRQATDVESYCSLLGNSSPPHSPDRNTIGVSRPAAKQWNTETYRKN